MKQYKAVLFDLDGTLLDTAEDLRESLNAVLSAFHFPLHTPEAIRSFIGQGIKEFVRSALPLHARDPAMTDHCYQLMQREYALHWQDHTKPFPQIFELLQTLSNRGYKTAVLSNKEDFFTKEMVAAIFPGYAFSLVMGSTPAIPPKPDPTGARLAAKKLHLDSKEFLYVGDSEIDMETATTVGMQPVWAMWGYGNEKRINTTVIRIQYPLELLQYV